MFNLPFSHSSHSRLILGGRGFDNGVYAMNITTGLITRLCHLPTTVVSFAGSGNFNSRNQMLQFCFDQCFNVHVNETNGYFCKTLNYELPKMVSCCGGRVVRQCLHKRNQGFGTHCWEVGMRNGPVGVMLFPLVSDFVSLQVC